MSRKLNVLIVGGTGVLSGAMASYFVEEGHSVTILTDGNGVLPEPDRIVRHLIVDRNEKEELKHAFDPLRDESWDLLIDCVCYTSEQASSILEIISPEQCNQIFVISSYLVYSDSNAYVAESYQLKKLGNLRSYESGKIWMEEVYQASGRVITILRLPHVLGAGALLGIHAMHNRDYWLLKRLRDSKPLFLADGGEQLFQFVFAKDVAAVVKEVFLNSGFSGKIYNCANPRVFTARDYFSSIADCLGLSVNFKPIPSSVLRDGNWGWESTLSSKLMDISKLSHVVPKFKWTSLSDAHRICIRYLDDAGLEMDNTYHCFDALKERMDVLIDMDDAATIEALVSVVQSCREKRRTSVVGERLSRSL